MAKYYYNGALLPEIPPDILDSYPYVFIGKSTSSGNYIFRACKVKWWVKNSKYFSTSSEFVIYQAIQDEWEYVNTMVGADTSITFFTNLWSNHDIPNGSATASAIYFYSTYPIPEADECYYNGVRLPAIPPDVLAEYPYACILGSHQLLVAKQPWLYSSNNSLVLQPACKNQKYVLNNEAWTLNGTWTDTGGWSVAYGVLWSNHDIRNGSATSTTIYFYGNSPVAVKPETPTERTRGYLIRSGYTLYTVTDGALTALAETEITANLFQTYGVDDLPDGSLLVGLTDPEVLYWQDSTDELPTLSLTVKGTPPLPQVFTSEAMDLTHESIAGISHAAVDASEDVRFAISFDDGANWKAFDGSAWFDVSDTAPGMLASTMNAITAQQWAEVVQLTAYRLRFWLPNVTAFVKSVVIHYINP